MGSIRPMISSAGAGRVHLVQELLGDDHIVVEVVLIDVTCAPIARTVRGIRSEVEVGPEHGLAETCVIICDNVITVPLDALDDNPVGHLDEITRAALDRALRYALDIVY